MVVYIFATLCVVFTFYKVICFVSTSLTGQLKFDFTLVSDMSFIMTAIYTKFN